MRIACAVAVAVAVGATACSKRDARTDPAPPPPRTPDAAAVQRVVALPHLTATGLGALTGDVPFRLADVRAAVPELAWQQRDASEIDGTLDGKPAVIVRGARFVKGIEVGSPAIPLDVGVALGALGRDLKPRLQLMSCTRDNGPRNASDGDSHTECSLTDPLDVMVVLDGSCPARPLEESQHFDAYHVFAVRVRTSPSQALRERLSHHAAPAPRDPVIAATGVWIDRNGIHPISDAHELSAAALAKLVPKLDVTEQPPGTLVASRAGVPVLRVELVDHHPHVVVALHPSLRSKLPIAIGQAFADAQLQTADLACGDDRDPLHGFCYFADAPRIALRVTAAAPLPVYWPYERFANDSPGGGFAIDAVVDAVEWTAREPVTAWPAVSDDAIGPLTWTMLHDDDIVHASRALPDFDVVPTMHPEPWFGFELRLAGKTVLTYNRIATPPSATLGPMFKLLGQVGVGTTLGEARAIVGDISCVKAPYNRAPPAPDEPGDCFAVAHPCIELDTAPAASFDARVITALVWQLSMPVFGCRPGA